MLARLPSAALAAAFEFTTVSTVRRSAPAKTTGMMALNIYKTFYGEGRSAKGVGQAEGVIFFVIVVAISLLQLFLTRRKEVQA